MALQRFRDTARNAALSTSLTDYFESESVTSYISVKTKENDSIRAGFLVLSDRLSSAWQRMRDAPLSTRNARNHRVSLLPHIQHRL